jgi:flagellar basal-body rod protein FlgG
LNTSLLISASSLQTFQQKLDSVSNNIANVNTTGYKRREATFSEILASQINNHGQLQPNQEEGRLTPEGIREGYGSRLGLTQLEMDQGQPVKTENPFDLMINGKGFFQIGYQNGGKLNIRYTRDGSFHLSRNPNQSGTYHLVNQNGGYLLDQKGAPIVLDGSNRVQFAANGEILLQKKNGQVQVESTVGIVDIKNPHLLQNAGDNEFEIASHVLPNGTISGNYVRTMQPGETEIQSGYLEESNVDLTKEMTDLITTQRGFQMNARAVSYADQMMGIANNILK